METNWTRLVTVRELGRRRKLRVEVGDTAVALFQADDRIYAFRDLCIHQDRSLAKGTLLHGRVICRATSGRSTSTPATRKTRTCASRPTR